MRHATASLGAATKDRIACTGVWALSVYVELLIQMDSSRAAGVKDCKFLVARLRFQPSARKACSSAQYKDDACIASYANTGIDSALFGRLVPRKQAISSVVGQTLGE